MQNITEKTASRFLGKKASASDFYDPSLLVAIPRQENRSQYNIDENNLPFEGWDIWHAYEFSALTENGIPVTRLMKIKYSCKSKFLVESKSLKLYLNSFNMSRFGKTRNECLEICKNKIQKDLSEKLLTEATVDFIENDSKRTEIFKGFKNIFDYVDESTLKIDKYNEAPELIKVKQNNKQEKYFLTFDSLRSNCRVTHQPDFGDVFIYYKSDKHIDESSLVAYLCSFRSEFHFHEECCEMIYKRLFDILNKDDELLVCALYTRRGGIDICPERRSKNLIFEDINNLIDTLIYARNSIKQ